MICDNMVKKSNNHLLEVGRLKV